MRTHEARIRPWRGLAALVCALAGSAGLYAQPMVGVARQNVVQLTANAAVEVQQDVMSVTMSALREGSDASGVQNQLKAVVDAALTEARKAAQPGQMAVRSGSFSLQPRYGRDAKLTGWQGVAEVILEGADFVRIGAAAGRIPGMTVAGVSFGLSGDRRLQAEGEAQAQAIERFKSRAQAIARGFGFNGYSLLEINVNTSEPGFTPRPRAMALEARSISAEAPLPMEVGKIAVLVTVAGSVQLK